MMIYGRSSWLSWIIGLLIASGSTAASAEFRMAEAEIRSCNGENISGSAVLREKRSEEGVKVVDIFMRVKGLTPGKHAVHIHEVGTCLPCGAAEGHFDPGPNGNSNPDANHPFHSGDLVNIDAKRGKGTATLHTETTRVTLSDGPLSLFDENGSAFIIHVDPDTYCPEGEVLGCAGGARLACGVITSADDG